MMKNIKDVEQIIWARPFNPILQDHISRLILQRERLFLFRQKTWGGTSRKKWLCQGDKIPGFS